MIVLTVAVLIDAVIADPIYRLHPVRLMGRLIEALQMVFYRSDSNRLRLLGGFCLVLTGIIIVALLCTVLLALLNLLPLWPKIALQALLVSQLLATRSLHREGARIGAVLATGDLALAKRQIGYLVSRDTDQLSRSDIYKAAVETLTENTTDAIIAPYFYYALFGLYGLAIYKFCNTMDSMIGYKNDKYLFFGRVAARLDDVLNFLPARAAALMIVLLAFVLGDDYRASFRCLLTHSQRHSSPNAGCTEAAMAGALAIKLSGPTRYFGKWHERPSIGFGTAHIGDVHLTRVMQYVIGVALIGYLCALLLIWW